MAIAWIFGASDSLDTCMREAMVQAVQIASDWKGRAKRVIMASNWTPECTSNDGIDIAGYASTTLEAVTAANSERIPIDTVYVPFASWYVLGFWDALAAANDGKYTLVDEFIGD